MKAKEIIDSLCYDSERAEQGEIITIPSDFNEAKEFIGRYFGLSEETSTDVCLLRGRIVFYTYLGRLYNGNQYVDADVAVIDDEGQDLYFYIVE